MSDLIERGDAIKALYKYNFVTKEVIEREIRLIPSADTDLSGYSDKLWKNAYERGKTDRPRGEWETVGEKTPYKRCPFCKRVRAFPDTRFCDWCGAKMKGADDE